MLEAKQQLRNLKPYKPGKNIEDVKEELGLKKIVKLASNENPFGCSQKAKEAIEREMKELAIYPDGYAAALREKTSNFLGVKPENLLFGNGTDEVIQMLCRAYLTPGSNTVMAHPTFSQFKHNAFIEGAEIREIPIENGQHDLNKMADAVDEQTKIVWLCMINNPSGEYIRHSEFVSFMESVPRDVLVFCDEAYYEYVVAEDFADSFSLFDKYPNLIISRTFSKAYGLAALRVGYAVAHADVITPIEAVRPPFNTSRIGQTAAASALADQEFIKKCRDINREGLQKFYDFCEASGLSYYPSQANFILIDFGRSGDEVYDYLLKHGFIVRPGTVLGHPTAARITVGDPEQTKELIDVLSEWVQQ